MKWPERPTCHGSTEATWRPVDLNPTYTCSCGYENLGPYGYPFRTCSYCGSINPEDLIRLSKTDRITLHGSDWKYQFPHKFYVEGIANPLADQLVDSSSSSRSFDHQPTQAEIESAKRQLGHLQNVEARVREPGWCPGFPANTFWNICAHGRSPAPAMTFSKFYTAHLEDIGYDEEAHDLLLQFVSERSGIRFFRTGDSPIEGHGFAVHYQAPYFGYQRRKDDGN